MKQMLLPILLLASLPVQAAVFQVTKTADTLDGACDHDCSLREAIVAANTASNAAAGMDFVVLGPGVYELTRLGPFEDASATGDLDVLDALAIVGAGADRTVLDGSQIDRVLQSIGQHTLEVHGVTVRNGWARGSGGIEDAGGGIAAYELLLVDSVVSDNRAQLGGGIWTPRLTARGSTISGNVGIDGGGIAVVVLHLSNVTLSGNLGRHGGGMYRIVEADDDSEIADTTVTGNSATVAGGGLYSAGVLECPAGGGCPSPPDIRIERSIVAGNTAPEKPDCANLENEG
ncbi:MAG TPA: CSLREA domain-containing protein, partial [Thermoanaerobaculia bacterium]